MIIDGYTVALELGEFELRPVTDEIAQHPDVRVPPDDVPADPPSLDLAVPEADDTVQSDTFFSTGPLEFEEGDIFRHFTTELRAGLLILPGGGGEIGGADPGQGNVFDAPLVQQDVTGGLIEGNTFLEYSYTFELFGQPSGAALVLEDGGSNTVGGAAPGDGNTLGDRRVLTLNDDHDVIQGNTMGGLDLDGSFETIGGTASSPGEAPGNRIVESCPTRPCGGTGVTIGGGWLTKGNVLQGNLISGFANGIVLGAATDTTIGGSDEDDGNLIIGDTFPGGAGVTFPSIERIDTTEASGKTLRKFLEFDFRGALSDLFMDLPVVGASNNLVRYDLITGFADGVAFGQAPEQDTPATQSELIRTFLYPFEGVKYDPSAEQEPRHDTITQNQMSADGLGISFGGTFHHNEVEPAPGPNDYQFYPLVLSSSVSSGNVTVQLRLDDLPTQGHTTFKIDLYAQGPCEENSITPGIGNHFLGQSLLTTGLLGDGTTMMTVPIPVTASALTATATAPNGDTSEFGPCLTLGDKAAGS
jgi:hypothetical protein